MSYFNSHLGTPRIEGQHPDIYPGSPAALIAVFVDIVRARFTGDNAYQLPYYWDPDPTPEEIEDNSEDKPRKIIIEDQYTQDPDARDPLPAIFIDRGTIQYQKIVLGNRGAYDIPTSAQEFVCHGITPISVLCVAKEKGESANLADIVSFYLIGSMNSIREYFGIQDITMPIVESTQVYRRTSNAIETWVTPVNIQITCKYIWREIPIAPKLKEIAIKFSIGK